MRSVPFPIARDVDSFTESMWASAAATGPELYAGALAAVFLPWWGDPPSWRDHFLHRAALLRSLVPVLVGDAALWPAPGRVERVPCMMDAFEQRAREVSGIDIHKCDPRFPRGQALCELRPLMAAMYPDVIAPYAWWGYGDWDVVWGDWDTFLVGGVVSHFDVISTNPRIVNGPLSLFRQSEITRDLYLHDRAALASRQAQFLDETGMSRIVEAQMADGHLRVLYAGGLNAHDRTPETPRCVLVDGKLYPADVTGRRIGHEILKFHFPGMKQWPVILTESHEAVIPIAHHPV